MILAKPTAVCCCATSPPYLFTSASQAIETLVPTCRTLLFSTRSLVSPVWKIMPRKSQLTTQACIILPFAVVSFGLGYFASSQRRKNNAAYVRVISDEESDGDVVQVQTPHPAWTPGQNQPPPQGLDTGHVRVDPRDCKSCYALMVSAVIPRPVAFVSTQAADGTVNLSPFSYFNTVGHEPPMLAVSICRNHDGGKKDTLVNIEASGEFVVSIISDWFVESANHTCGGFPPEVDEMKLAGLTPVKSNLVSPPRVKESGMNMECKVHHMYEIVNHKGKCTTTVVFGEVVMFHVFPHLLDEAAAAEGKPFVHLKGYKPIARLGGNTYARLGSAFDLRRPNVKK